MEGHCIASPTLRPGFSDRSGISSADIATALLLSVVRTSENPLTDAKEIHAHAAKLHTLTSLLTNPIFYSLSLFPQIQSNENAAGFSTPDAAVMELL